MINTHKTHKINYTLNLVEVPVVAFIFISTVI